VSTTNRVRLTSVEETTPGVTPTSPRMRLERITSESLTAAPRFVDSAELRSDRMQTDSIETVLPSGGGATGFEFSYPEDNSPWSSNLKSAFYSAWVNTPTFDNDGTADSVVTDAGTSANTYAVVSGGASVVVGHLVRATGFTNAANNQIFRVASSTSTTIVGTALSLTAEAAPPAAAKLKVVGFQGAAGDIIAAASSLTSTVLDFTTLGLHVGQTLKIGGDQILCHHSERSRARTHRQRRDRRHSRCCDDYRDNRYRHKVPSHRNDRR
jgi:hypothetical protein